MILIFILDEPTKSMGGNFVLRQQIKIKIPNTTTDFVESMKLNPSAFIFSDSMDKYDSLCSSITTSSQTQRTQNFSWSSRSLQPNRSPTIQGKDLFFHSQLGREQSFLHMPIDSDHGYLA
ncbi:hypothetical protein Nepgr_005504 [Nepenthes gracilis]|uniref:Uncharacterized protein n=1 Tax=Nepenthes gracilis TaxID=150966 RepID=A0AAD3S3M7_NEPGR|nr:hypothetical protein Nepgr_005504 [Nepenthes gracilis]